MRAGCSLEQLTSPVAWTASCERLAADHPDALFVEMGPGSVLTGLVKKIAPPVQTATCGTAAEVEQLLSEAGADAHRSHRARTALVTGSTRGIGRAIAETLAECGARVAVVGRDAATSSGSRRADRAATRAGFACDVADIGVGDRARRGRREGVRCRSTSS